MGIPIRSLFFSFLLSTQTLATPTVKCYSCITPWDGGNFDQLCSDDSFCEGIWCTKGPDERSNGILHGCSNIVPLERRSSDCKAVNRNETVYFNCYCNNIDYCNSNDLPKFSIMVTIVLLLFKQFC